MSDDSKLKSGTREWGAGRVAFLAKLGEVRGERAAGRSFAAIYRALFDGVMSIQQFRRYVKRYVGSSHEDQESAPAAGAAPTPRSKQTASSSPPAVPRSAEVPSASQPAAPALEPSESGLDQEALNNITASKIDLQALALLHHQRPK